MNVLVVLAVVVGIWVADAQPPRDSGRDLGVGRDWTPGGGRVLDRGSGGGRGRCRGPPQIRCFVNPCTVLRCLNFPQARCRPTDPCEPSCTGAFFIGSRQLSQMECQNSRGRGRDVPGGRRGGLESGRGDTGGRRGGPSDGRGGTGGGMGATGGGRGGIDGRTGGFSGGGIS